MNNIIYSLLIGAVSGWLAGVIKKGHGFGLFGNIIIGIIGAVMGGWIFGMLGIAAGSVAGYIVMSIIGALALLFIIGLFK